MLCSQKNDETQAPVRMRVDDYADAEVPASVADMTSALVANSLNGFFRRLLLFLRETRTRGRPNI